MKRLIFLALILCSSSAFAMVVQPVGASSQVLIPAAGSVQGAFGAFFRSDITIVNLAGHDQTVTLQWLPEAATGQAASTTTIQIPALSGVRSSDFVSEFLHQTGLGSIIVTGTAPGGVGLDTTARLFVSSRIWTPISGGGPGTTSQSFPTIPVSTINTPIAAFFGTGGADNVSNYRVNIGIVNLDPVNAQTFVVQVASPPPVPPAKIVTLPPLTMEQVPLGNGLPVSAQLQVQNVTSAATRSNFWTAYATSTDNSTNDSWSELAVVGTTP